MQGCDRGVQLSAVQRTNAEVGSAANSYEILAKLAMGGMAEIFLARGASAAGVERYVVLKRVLRHKATDETFMRMFLDEARLAAQLQHPNIAQVYDIGTLGDSYFFTMEYVHGETVRNLLQRSYGLRRPIAVSAVLSIIAGAAAGLHHAHERKGFDGKHLGIVHRDVSPSNLMISYEGTVKVVDFGVAKAAHRETETRSGTVKGKITYMSPEQCRGHDMDRRSDLFSLGIVMWEMLTTERLFRRNSDFETMQAIVSEDVAPPSRLRPDIPADVDAVVMKLLAKSPADRYQTADELHEAIETVAVRAGSALSTASLGRFMRELFGQRPEPWIELQLQDAQPEHTVTSEPLVSGLGVSPADDLDLQLSAVPLLSQRSTAEQMPATAPPPRPPLLTIPLRVQADDMGVTLHLDSRAPANESRRHQGPSLQPPAPHPGSRMQPSPVSATPMPSLIPVKPVMPLRPNAPLAPPSSSPYPTLQSSGSYAAHSGSSTGVPKAVPPRSRGILIPVCIVGTFIGIAIAIKGTTSTASDESAREPEHTTQMKQTSPPTPEAPPPTSVAPAAPAAVREPAYVPVPPPPPAATPPPSDGAVIVEEPPPPVKRPPVAKRDPTPDVATLFKAGRFGDVVEACSDSAKLASLSATTCTVAACKTREATKAKRWISNVTAGKRANIIRDCAGVFAAEPAKTAPVEQAPSRIERPPTKAELCKRDPLACQH